MSVNSKMTAIADAIRAKTGKTAPLSLDQMATEIEGISGGTELFAAIVAYYPTGSTIKCISGNIELSPVGTDGQCVFAIPKAGTWTVTAILGTETASDTVVITTEGQFESVVLSYRLVLFDNGDQNTKVTGGWSNSGYTDAKYDRSNSKVTIGSKIVCSVDGYNDLSGIAGTANKVSLNNVKSITIDGNLSEAYKGVYDEYYIGFSSSKAISSFVASVKITEAGNFTKSLDVSALTGSYYVVVAAMRTNAYCTEKYTCELSVESMKSS